jgi:enamine deaminase RidA (YjgF/YER057c/UK114 family)
MAIRRISPGTVNSRAVVYNNVAYLSGYTADDKTGGVAGQTRQILDKIDKALAECGSDKTRLLSAVVVLADISKREELNGVWKTWVAQADLPARMAHQGALGTPDTLVEIMVTAATDR